MYWVHRFGHGRRSKEFNDDLDIPAMCQLLKDKNCLTVGWLCFASTTENYNPDIVNAVENGNADKVMNLMLNAGITRGWARSLVNFTKMQVGDIVVVLPNKDYFPYFFVVEIKDSAKSILNSPPNMTTPFNVNGFDYNFSSNSGWSRSFGNEKNERFDVGFFHEVEILTDSLPRDLIGHTFDYVRSTNSPVHDVSTQQYIESFIKKPKP